MKTYKDITKKYLLENKGRTITTICGIILSVALITSIMFFINGIYQNFIEREINASGEYHTSFMGLSNDEFEKMKSHPGVKLVGLNKNLGEITANNGDYNFIFEFNAVTKGAENLFPYDIEQGRFGENDSEVVIDVHTAKELSKDIGDIITLNIDKKKSEYKIVGIIDEQMAYGSRGIGQVVLSTNLPLGSDTIIAFEGNRNGLRKTLDELKNMTDKESFENNYYLSYIGAGRNLSRNKAMVMMAIIIISLVITTTVLVIKNAFYISIVSRLKEFGLLKAIGATSKQLKSMILKEATIIASISVPFGLLFGVLAIIVVDKILKILSEDQLIISLNLEIWILVVAGILGFITTYICALLPAKELKKISALEAIDNREGIKKEKIKRIKFSFIEKLLNIRSIMAYRNIKRNKKRYNSTILGLTISMIIFIVFSSYMRMVMNDALNYNSSSIDIPDYSLYIKQEVSDEKIESLSEQLNKINDISLIERGYGSCGLVGAVIDDKKLNKTLVNQDNYMDYNKLDDKYSTINPMITSMKLKDGNIKLLNKYLIDGNIDVDYIRKNNGIIMVKERMHYLEEKYKMPIADLNVGDKINLFQVSSNSDEDGNIKFNNDSLVEVEIVAIVSELPSTFGDYDLIIPNTTMKNIIGFEMNDEINGVDAIEIRLDDKQSIETKTLVENVLNKYNMEYQSIDKQSESEKAFINQIKFLIYGFIMVIGLISCTNIFNTMSTNIIFRRREIAALRAIGMSKKEMRNMIIKEGALYGIISVIYAVIIGTIINIILYKQLTTITNFKFNIGLDIILGVGIVAILMGIIASLIPLRKIDESSIIEDLKFDN